MRRQEAVQTTVSAFCSVSRRTLPVFAAEEGVQICTDTTKTDITPASSLSLSSLFSNCFAVSQSLCGCCSPTFSSPSSYSILDITDTGVNTDKAAGAGGARPSTSKTIVYTWISRSTGGVFGVMGDFLCRRNMWSCMPVASSGFSAGVDIIFSGEHVRIAARLRLVGTRAGHVRSHVKRRAS